MTDVNAKLEHIVAALGSTTDAPLFYALAATTGPVTARALTVLLPALEKLGEAIHTTYEDAPPMPMEQFPAVDRAALALLAAYDIAKVELEKL